ncbi:putative 28S rRNA (cytosine-C(5))-methyltransferase [Thelohanellus kitauei]|uniref:Putative 28S rRNA (Cytosine-C(5))-methyltransferase n=1 Tax=Thelohanellus kitauei TaxID=669202 RepID=A0A0C2J3M5_THEKT|nr:putative 28S rRNA (cytosine-C(5))-methyltransferase [Thelohanellus kitauei]
MKSKDGNDIYLTVGHLIDESLSKKISVKALCYGSIYKDKKMLLALLVKTLSYKSFIDELIVNIGNFDKKVSYGVWMVLIYEQLFGRGHRNYYWRNLIKPHLAQMKHFMARYMKEKNIKHKKDICIKCSPGMAENHHRFEFVTFSANSYVEYLKCEAKLSRLQFCADPIIDNVLIFHPNTDFHNAPLVKNGYLILQDKASCLPAQILCPSPSSYVLDCCAAPGNKTSQLSAIMGNKGHLIALDKDNNRLKRLKKNMSVRNCKCDAINADFLTISPNEYPYNHIKYILLDPTCSSSGLHRNFNNLVVDDLCQKRKAAKKSLFQKKALFHALSFPRLMSLVYSTCSIYECV